MIVDVIIDSLIDNLKILPFLFITFLLMEYIEDNMKMATREKMAKAGKFGPVFGSLLGIVPQCGFSAAASNLYAGRVISVGTLIAIFLATSDEMLPILIGSAASPALIFEILIIKVIYGIIIGLGIDCFLKIVMKKPEEKMDIHHFCEHENCECGHGILMPAIKHTVKIFAFLLVISVTIGFAVEYWGLDFISNSILSNKFVGPIICGLIGLIPNCGASVFLTAVFLEGAVSFGTMMSGLFAGSGVGILVLARVNDNKKDNVKIISFLYLCGVLGGIFLNIFIK